MIGIRIRGVTESTEKDFPSRQKHDSLDIRTILVHLDVTSEIRDIVKFGMHDEKENRTILLKISKVFQRLLILASAKKPKNPLHLVFMSKQLKTEEAILGKKSLIKRRDLIVHGMEPKELHVKDGILRSELMEDRIESRRRLNDYVST